MYSCKRQKGKRKFGTKVGPEYIFSVEEWDLGPFDGPTEEILFLRFRRNFLKWGRQIVELSNENRVFWFSQ